MNAPLDAALKPRILCLSQQLQQGSARCCWRGFFGFATFSDPQKCLDRTPLHSIGNRALNSQPINLLFASDNDYLKYTATTLASVLESIRDPRPLRVFVMLDRELPEEALSKFSKLQTIRDFEFVPLVVDASAFSNIRTTPGITIATYYRLLAHELLPIAIEKLLYLDSDLIVRKCISTLYDTDLTGFLFAGVNDSIHRDYSHKFGTPLDAPHINAGVMLMALKQLREVDFSARLSSFLKRKRYLITLGDQQIINGEFYDEILPLPVEWNVHGSMFDKSWRLSCSGLKNDYSVAELERATEDPAVIHYTYKRKPWMAPDHPRAQEWARCSQLTEFFR